MRDQRTRGLIGRLLRQEMAAGQTLAADILGFLAPGLADIVDLPDQPHCAPKREQRHSDARFGIRGIMLQVDPAAAR